MKHDADKPVGVTLINLGRARETTESITSIDWPPRMLRETRSKRS
jgi:hypothetical protein